MLFVKQSKKVGFFMDGENVQNQDLVNDQVTQALNDSGVTADAGAGDPVVPAPTTDAPEAAPLPATELPDTMETTATVAQPTDAPEAAPLPADAMPADEPEATVAAPASEPEEDKADDTPAPSAPSNPGDENLLNVKRQALEQLSPLVEHLDLPSDKKFDTYMEILRASDDAALVQPAFEAAQNIEDEDKKAQALLDVVNEVNYLTQDTPQVK